MEGTSNQALEMLKEIADNESRKTNGILGIEEICTDLQRHALHCVTGDYTKQIIDSCNEEISTISLEVVGVGKRSEGKTDPPRYLCQRRNIPQNAKDVKYYNDTTGWFVAMIRPKSS